MSASRRRRAIVILLVLALAGFATWRLVLARSAVSPGVIAVSGRIEGDDSAVAAKTSGRIREMTVREGDQVEAGQVIAVLDDEQIRARETQAEAAVRQAEARVRLAQHQITVLNESMRQSEIGVDQARGDAQGKVSEAEGRLAAAEAQLAQAEASYTQAKWDREAFARLFQRELIAEQEARRAQSTEEAQAAVVSAARRQVEAARGALMAAKANLSNPAIRASQVAAVQGQILQAQADIAAAQAEAERARAMLQEARANRQDLRIVAPFAGTVATRTAEPGEVVMAGTPVITLLNLSEVYLRAFVPEGQIGRVTHQPAGPRLPRFLTDEARRRLRAAGGPAGLVHAGEHLLPRRSREAGGRGQAPAPRRRGLRQAGHAGGWRDPRRGQRRGPRSRRGGEQARR